jgi:nitronate monooxygenase
MKSGMWPKVLARRLGVEYPILLAPMAGGPGTPDLVAAVSEAGALGSFGAGYLSAEAIRRAISDIRARTRRPFAVNLFVPDPIPRTPGQAELAAANAPLDPIRKELGLDAPAGLGSFPGFAEQLAIVKEEHVPVFSFTFGALAADEVSSLHQSGITVLGTATTVQEARTLEASGVDVIVAQGSEAGGHRGTFAVPPERALIGTLALVPQVCDAVKVPVVAAGGIMDGRGLVAAFALGAAAAQMGTAFLACLESGAHQLQKQALLTPQDDDATRLTRAFSGRLARGFGNRFMVDVERAGAILPYPHQAALTNDIRQAAARQGRAEFLSMWAGQGAPLAVAKGAGELVRDLVEQAERVVKALH